MPEIIEKLREEIDACEHGFNESGSSSSWPPILRNSTGSASSLLDEASGVLEGYIHYEALVETYQPMEQVGFFHILFELHKTQTIELLIQFFHHFIAASLVGQNI